MNNHTSSLLSKYLQSVGAAALTVCAFAVAQEFHLRLNGPSDFVTVNHDQRFDTQTFTVTAWVRTVSSPPTTPVDPRLQLAIVSRGNSSGHKLPWRLAIRQDGTLGLLWESVADGDLVGPTACPGPTCTWPVVNDGSWHVVGVSMSFTPGLGGGVTYVVDHHSHFESRPSNHAPTIDSASAVTFGAELTMGVPNPSTALARTATADLDQITIWDRALSAPEILALAQGTWISVPWVSPAIGRWRKGRARPCSTALCRPAMGRSWGLRRGSLSGRLLST